MKRKILSVIMVIAMILAAGAFTAGCGEDEAGPVDAYNKAAENMSKADDVDLDGKIAVVIKAEGQSMEMGMDLNATMIKSETDDPADLQMAMKMSMELMGQKINTQTYIKDKTMYTDDGQGQKSRTEMDEDSSEAFEKVFGGDVGKIDEYVKSSERDGETVKLVLDGEKAIKAAVEKMNEIGDDASEAVDMSQIEESLKNAGVKDINVTANISDENFTSLKFDVPMEMDMAAFNAALTGGSASGASQKIKADLTIDFSKIAVNSGAKIDFPDLSDYK